MNLRRLWLLALWVTFAIACGGTRETARSASIDDEKQRDLYIQRALQPPADPALVGRKERGSGTGFYVTEDTLLTNYHVVRDCPIVSAQHAEADSAPAAVSVVATDQVHDLALLRDKRRFRVSATFETALGHVDTSDLSVVGYPSQGMVVLRPTITAAKARPDALETRQDFFPFYADVRPGNSGGPLIDEYGGVIGVVTRRLDPVITYERTGQVEVNEGFAIPNRVTLEFLRAHRINYRSGKHSEDLAPEERLARARLYVSRVRCWQ